jgi:GR25 family glycosyltransferase involved in LPS biosynthesis
MPRTPKRPRQEKKRPPPPPDPPASLVHLLQRDNKVLQYFQSLQLNLRADVQVWKERAKRYEEEKGKLQTQLDASRAQGAKSDPKKKRRSSNMLKAEAEGSYKIVDSKQGDASETIFASIENKEDDDAGISVAELDGGDSDFDRSSRGKDLGNAPTPAIPFESIQDDMFEFASSSDEDEDEQSQTYLPQMREGSEQQHENRNGNSSVVEDWQEVFQLLSYAHNCLAQLGVTLVEKRPMKQSATKDVAEEGSLSKSPPAGVVPTDNDGMDYNSERPEQDGIDLNRNNDVDEEESFLGEAVPKCDADIAAEILYAVRSACRVHLQDHEISRQVLPFVTEELIPACDYYDHPKSRSAEDTLCSDVDSLTRKSNIKCCHPARTAKQLALHALMIMDSFCDPDLTDEEWDSYFECRLDSPVPRSLRVGLRGRRVLAQSFITSLSGEISEEWAVADRTARSATAALNFDKASSTDAFDSKVSTSLLGGSRHQSRLANLLERCVLCQVLVAWYLTKDKPQQAAHVVLSYILSNVPSLQIEDYPGLYPTLSLTVLESFLIPDRSLLCQSGEEVDPVEGAWFFRTLFGDSEASFAPHGLQDALVLCIHATAGIWKERLVSTDGRISLMSQVELASYSRLLQSEARWLASNEVIEMAKWTKEIVLPKARSLAVDICDPKTLSDEANSFPLQLIWTLEGILPDLSYFNDGLTMFGYQAVAWSEAKAQIEIRKIDGYRERIGSKTQQTDEISSIAQVFESILPRLSTVEQHDQIRLLATILGCAARLADGSTVYRVAHSLFGMDTPKADEAFRTSFLKTIDMVLEVGQRPLIRVINLSRRDDRWHLFKAQAMRERLYVIKAVVTFQADISSEGHLPQYFGGHAFDGQGRLAEAHARLAKAVGTMPQLKALVETQWRPNDLKPFDRDAPDAEDQVLMSPTERGCALSHISSWKGVLSSLRLPSMKVMTAESSNLFQYSDRLLRLFRISGFACGPALCLEHADMSPSPVCVILEDDAVMCDRFADRLHALLQELPRDFHFCSLGYSRPKTAPIVPYQNLIGIPTGQWYLTGYVLSEAGAEYLQTQLPVVGPIDSWIGLLMLRNWDNVYGMTVGVGIQSKALASQSFARKELVQILRFRAFCALSPLCSQKVATSGNRATGRNWRNRDTDIVYSGDDWRRKSSTRR